MISSVDDPLLCTLISKFSVDSGILTSFGKKIFNCDLDNMQRSIPYQHVGVSMRLKEVHEKLSDCRSIIHDALVEIEEKFPKSIFDNVEPETYSPEMYQVDEDYQTQSDDKLEEDMISETPFDQESAVLTSSPPLSPTASNFTTERPLSPETGRRLGMLRMFKISTGSSQLVGRPFGDSSIPMVTSLPRDPVPHCMLHLYKLELPKSLGVVVRLAASEQGYLAGCTVHGELFAFTRLPFSRHPDSIVTRGHDSAVTSIVWVSRDFFLTSGADRKTLLWQVSPGGLIEGPQVELVHSGESAIPTCCSVHPINRDIVIIGFLDHSFAMFKVVLSGGPSLAPLGISASFPKPITSLSVSPNGRRLAVGSSAGTVGLFDLNTLSLDVEVDCRNRSGPTSGGRKVTNLDWSPDSTCIAVSSCDSRIRIILVSDLSRRTKFKSIFFTSENLFLGSVFDDERVLSVSENGHFCSWNIHIGNKTNDSCLRCDLLASHQDKDSLTQIVASLLLAPSSGWAHVVQDTLVSMGPHLATFVVSADNRGVIRIFAELAAA